MLDGYYDQKTADILVAPEPMDAPSKDKVHRRETDPFRAAMMLNFHVGLFVSSRLLGLK